MGTRVVYVTGCWDLLHIGHLFFLEEAAKLGEALVVGVNTDEFIRTYKPWPIIPFAARCRIVASLPMVDIVEPHATFDDVEWIERHEATIRAVGPEFGLHSGQQWCLEQMKQRGVEVVVIPWGPDVSSQQIREDCYEKMAADRACPVAPGGLQAGKTAHLRHHTSRRGESIPGSVCPTG